MTDVIDNWSHQYPRLSIRKLISGTAVLMSSQAILFGTHMLRSIILILASTALLGCELNPVATNSASTVTKPRVLIYGASGRLGKPIAEEGILRNYPVTAISRDPSRLSFLDGRAAIKKGDILDRKQLRDLASSHDVIIVSVGGTPQSNDPGKYIAYKAAKSLLEVFEEKDAPDARVIFVGNLFTLEFEDGKTLLELGRVSDDHKNYAMFHGHQLALDAFRGSKNFNWTVASPPNGLRLKGRTGNVRFAGTRLLRDPDGKPSTISREDFAYAIYEELENANYVHQQFNTAR